MDGSGRERGKAAAGAGGGGGCVAAAGAGGRKEEEETQQVAVRDVVIADVCLARWQHHSPPD